MALRDDIDVIYLSYGAMIYRQAMVYLKNPSDCEEVLQDVMIKLLYKAPEFQSAEHEKRWLLRITINRCKDMLRYRLRRKSVPLDTIMDQGALDADRTLIHMVMELPNKYKAVVHLHYYEGYSVTEIAEIMHMKTSAVKMRLKRAREQLKVRMEDSYESR